MILDWKRTNSIKFDNAFRSLQEPLQHLPDSNIWLYGLFFLIVCMRAFGLCGWNKKRTSAEHLPLHAGNGIRHEGLQHVPSAGFFPFPRRTTMHRITRDIAMSDNIEISKNNRRRFTIASREPG